MIKTSQSEWKMSPSVSLFIYSRDHDCGTIYTYLHTKSVYLVRVHSRGAGVAFANGARKWRLINLFTKTLRSSSSSSCWLIGFHTQHTPMCDGVFLNILGSSTSTTYPMSITQVVIGCNDGNKSWPISAPLWSSELQFFLHSTYYKRQTSRPSWAHDVEHMCCLFCHCP